MITQFFAPEPVPKVALLARALVQRGHKVTVLTGLPCYPEGAIYPGYRRKLFLTERFDGVEVIRVPQLPDHSANPFRRIVYYASFPLLAALRLTGLRKRAFDVAYFYSSAVPILGLTWLVRLILRVPCIFDVADLWPESVESSGMLRSRRLLRLLRSVCGFLYRSADHIGAVTQGYKERLMTHGIPSERISVTYYCAPDLKVEPARALTDRAFTVGFTGMMGPSQGLGVLLDAAKLLQARQVPVRILLAGSGVEYEMLRARKEAENLTDVKFLGRLPADAMPQIYAQCDALFVHLKPDTLSTISIPSKTYSYLAAGRPIIMAVDGEAGRFIQENRCGLAIRSGDPEAIASAVEHLARATDDDRIALARNARLLFESKFSLESHVSVWEQVLKDFALNRP